MEFLESTNRRILDPGAIGLSSEDQRGREERSQSPVEQEVGADADRASEALIREQFQRSLLNGDEHLCRRAISAWYTIFGGMASVADGLIAPAFHSMGASWRCGDVDIYQERRAFEICMRLIHELRRLIPEPLATAPLAMGGTSDSDPYQLANQLIEVSFREVGWRTISLGSGVPFASMLAAAKKYNPRIFWMSVSHIENESDFLERFQEFSNELPRGVMLVVGGQALTDRLRPRMQFSAYCDSMHQLSTLGRNLRGAVALGGPQL